MSDAKYAGKLQVKVLLVLSGALRDLVSCTPLNGCSPLNIDSGTWAVRR